MMTRHEARQLYETEIEAAQKRYRDRITKIEASEKFTKSRAEVSKNAAVRRKEVLRMRNDGMKFKDIAEKLGISVTRARKIFVTAEWLSRPKTPTPITDRAIVLAEELRKSHQP